MIGPTTEQEHGLYDTTDWIALGGVQSGRKLHSTVRLQHQYEHNWLWKRLRGSLLTELPAGSLLRHLLYHSSQAKSKVHPWAWVTNDFLESEAFWVFYKLQPLHVHSVHASHRRSGEVVPFHVIRLHDYYLESQLDLQISRGFSYSR